MYSFTVVSSNWISLRYGIYVLLISHLIYYNLKDFKGHSSNFFLQEEYVEKTNLATAPSSFSDETKKEVLFIKCLYLPNLTILFDQTISYLFIYLIKWYFIYYIKFG